MEFFGRKMWEPGLVLFMRNVAFKMWWKNYMFWCLHFREGDSSGFLSTQYQRPSGELHQDPDCQLDRSCFPRSGWWGAAVHLQSNERAVIWPGLSPCHLLPQPNAQCQMSVPCTSHGSVLLGFVHSHKRVYFDLKDDLSGSTVTSLANVWKNTYARGYWKCCNEKHIIWGPLNDIFFQVADHNDIRILCSK